MATRILRSLPPETLNAFAWPQLGPRAQEAERQILAPAAEPPLHGPAQRDAACQQERAQWEARLHSEVETARREAFERGVEEGRREAAAQLESEFARLARAVEQAAGFKARLRAQAERELVELALAIARRILRRELHVDPEAVVGLAKAALEKASMREVTAVRLHPALAAPVRAHLARIGAPESIVVQDDMSLEPGAVLVETGRGIIDASMESQLDEIGRGLTDALATEGWR